jgi:H+-translocating NAD(P) transhydrogenase subunit alpha
MPLHASQLYANNVVNLLTHLAPEGELALDFDDEITAGAAVTHDGQIVNERVKEAVGAPA